MLYIQITDCYLIEILQWKFLEMLYLQILIDGYVLNLLIVQVHVQKFPDFRLDEIKTQWVNLGDPDDDSERRFFYNVIGQVAIVSAGDRIKVQPTFVLYHYSSFLNRWVEMNVEYLKIRYVTNAASTPEGFVLSDGTSEENGPWDPSNPNSGHEGMVQESYFPPFWTDLLNPEEGVDFNEYWKTHAVRIILTQIP